MSPQMDTAVDLLEILENKGFDEQMALNFSNYLFKNDLLRYFSHDECVTMLENNLKEIGPAPVMNGEDRQYLFHGTRWDYANNIKENGIALNWGSRKCDFSDGYGFYLTKSLEYAMKCAQKFRFPHSNVKVVVMVFSSPYIEQCSYSMPLLSWEQAVRYFRGQKNVSYPENLLEQGVLEGPVCKNVEEVCSNNALPLAGEFNQLCIVDETVLQHMKLMGILNVN